MSEETNSKAETFEDVELATPEEIIKRNAADQEAKNDASDLMYGIEDVPPWYLCILLGFQHYLTMFGGTVSIPFIICPKLCMGEEDPARGYIISTIFFVSGIVTFLQSTFGVRLPIIQGGTFSFLAPTFAILALPENVCPPDFDTRFTEDEKTEEWQRRMREIQGAIIVASFFQVFIGYFGIIGLMLKYITPMTIAPAVSMIGLSLFDVAGDYAAGNWGIAAGTMIFMIVFSQYMRNVGIPWMVYKNGKFSFTSIYVFKLFPVLMTIVTMWIICAILTTTDYLDKDDKGRTDLKINLLYNSQWIRFPYPFQWGWPTVSVAGVCGMLAGVIASAIESIGDYYACARLSGAPPPPAHAINRGIGTEGIGCIIAGIWGTGNGTTSYSENIGAIGVTKVGSRRVIQWGAGVMIVFGLFSKFGALFLTMPEPIVGGIFCVMFGMIAAVGLSNLQFVDMNSTRNLFVLGFSVFFGLVISKWMQKNSTAIQLGEGYEILSQVITVMLSTSMFVSGFLGFFLDNTVPGTPEERGLVKWRAQFEVSNEGEAAQNSCYELPFGMEWLRKMSWTKYIPCLPTFQGFNLNKVLPIGNSNKTN